jgi:hypothetical protein
MIPRRSLATAFWLVLLPSTVFSEEKPGGADWRPVGEVESYDPKTIYQAIDGAADLFIAFGFRSLREQTYARGDRRATVQIYEQGSMLDAFGVFAHERPPGAKDAGAGAGSASGKDGECVAYKGVRYVKAFALQGKLDAAACRALLATVTRRLPGGNEGPRELALLPASGRLPGTLGYTRQGFLGTRQLRDCVHADYKPARGGRTYTMFVLIPSAARRVDTIWRELASKWRVERFGKVELVSWRHPYRGTVGLISRGGAIVGAAGVGDSGATAALLDAQAPR